MEIGTPIVTVEHLGNRTFTEQNLPKVSDNDKERLKKYIIDALMRVVDSAPTRSNSQYNSYQTNALYRVENSKPYEITDESFKIWINYVFSVLNIAAQQVNSNLSYSVNKQIQSILYQNGADNATKTIEICRIILDYARNILNNM